jgi:hypothetical protein
MMDKEVILVTDETSATELVEEEVSQSGAAGGAAAAAGGEVCTTKPTSTAVSIMTKMKTTNPNKMFNKQTKMKKQVTFSTIHIREHWICVGDNPSVRKGAPISIVWEAHKEYSQPIQPVVIHHNNNNNNKIKKPNSSSSLEEMKMQSLRQFRLLKEHGHSLREIQEAIKQSNIVKRQRQVSYERSQRLEEVCERLAKAILNATIRRSRKQREREFLRPWKRPQQQTPPQPHGENADDDEDDDGSIVFMDSSLQKSLLFEGSAQLTISTSCEQEI